MTAAPVLIPATRHADIIVEYMGFVVTLDLGGDAVDLRRRFAVKFLAAHGDLTAWMSRPVAARRADLARIKAWPFIAWAILTGRVRADIAILTSGSVGSLHATAERLFPDEFNFVRDAGRRLGWNDQWTEVMIADTLTLAVAYLQRPPTRLTQVDLDQLAVEIADCPTAPASARRRHHHGMMRARRALYEAGILHVPVPSQRPVRGPDGQLAKVAAPEIRRVLTAYLHTRAGVLRPQTVLGMGNSLASFGEYLTEAHPDITELAMLERSHVEGFLRWLPTRRFRGHRAVEDRQISVVAVQQTIITLRTFLTDISVWGWSDAPRRQLIFAVDIPKLPEPLPRALTPHDDDVLMAAIADLEDPAARTGLTIIRSTGLRIGELVDLELGCIMNYQRSGTWLRVPLGKLNRERSVPLDDTALAAFDHWTSLRGRQRAIPHPRHGRPTDFVFIDHGRQIRPQRLRFALATAITAAGLVNPDGTPRKITPHQLRHTYATTLANGGISLQALMTLLGHQSPNMTMRYATLASPTLHNAYQQAIGRLRPRIPVGTPDRPAVPDHVEWLNSEMLKTRVAHGYCSRDPAADACAYANICENCANFTTTAAFAPALQAQLDDVTALRDDAEHRGWNSETARHDHLITSLQHHLDRTGHQPAT